MHVPIKFMFFTREADDVSLQFDFDIFTHVSNNNEGM